MMLHQRKQIVHKVFVDKNTFFSIMVGIRPDTIVPVEVVLKLLKDLEYRLRDGL